MAQKWPKQSRGSIPVFYRSIALQERKVNLNILAYLGRPNDGLIFENSVINCEKEAPYKKCVTTIIMVIYR